MEDGRDFAIFFFIPADCHSAPCCWLDTSLLSAGHQERLRHNLCPDALLLDCHSFPSELSDIDICIGYNEDWSKPNKKTIELAVNLFEDNGYKVGINEPYSNSETPDCPFEYQSMMLEVNKKAYMEPDSLRIKQPDSKKSNVRDLINILLSELEK